VNFLKIILNHFGLTTFAVFFGF